MGVMRERLVVLVVLVRVRRRVLDGVVRVVSGLLVMRGVQRVRVWVREGRWRDGVYRRSAGVVVLGVVLVPVLWRRVWLWMLLKSRAIGVDISPVSDWLRVRLSAVRVAVPVAVAIIAITV